MPPMICPPKRWLNTTKAVAAFPFQILVTIGITTVFGFLALIFLIALAL